MLGIFAGLPQMLGEVLVHLEHSHLVLSKNLPERVVGQDLAARFSGFCRLCERMYSHILLTTWPRDSGREPTTAASSSDGCSGFCRAFALPPLAFSGDLVAIDLLQSWNAVELHQSVHKLVDTVCNRIAPAPGVIFAPRRASYVAASTTRSHDHDRVSAQFRIFRAFDRCADPQLLRRLRAIAARATFGVITRM